MLSKVQKNSKVANSVDPDEVALNDLDQDCWPSSL